MSLPSLVAPEYPIQLVSQKAPIKIRPYLVKEEKLLLMAQQGGDKAEIEEAVKQIIRNCTNNVLDPDKLPSFDIEYLFLQLRAKSVNNIVETRFECQNRVTKVTGKGTGIETSTTNTCGMLVPVTINLDDIKVTVPKGHSNKVMLTKDLGVMLKYPTATTPTDDIVTALGDCLDIVFNETTGETWEIKEQNPKDIKDFIEGLSFVQMDLIRQKFFQTMPHLDYSFHFKCPQCGYEEDVTLTGLSDFFD